MLESSLSNILSLTSTLTLLPTTIAQTPIPINNLRHMPETTTAGVVRSVVGNQFIRASGEVIQSGQAEDSPLCNY